MTAEELKKEVDVLVRNAEAQNSILSAIETKVEAGDLSIPVPPWALADE